MILKGFKIRTDRGWLELSETKGKLWIEVKMVDVEGKGAVCLLDKDGFDELGELKYKLDVEDAETGPEVRQEEV